MNQYVTTNKYRDYISKNAKFLNICNSILNEIDQGTYFNKSIDELKADNEYLYQDILLDNYEKSILNPKYAVQEYQEIGLVLSAFSHEIRKCISYVFQCNKEMFDVLYRQSMTFFEALELNADEQQLKQIIKQSKLHDLKGNENYEINMNYNPNYNFYRNIIEKQNKDLKYLYRYGCYIDDSIIEYAKIANSLSESVVKQLAHTMVDSYLKGFKVRGKTTNKRKVSRVVSIAGLEKITLEILNYLETMDFQGHVVQAQSKPVNVQAEADHKDDSVIYFSDDYIEKSIGAYQYALAKNEKYLMNYLGNIIMVMFGYADPQLVINETKLSMSSDLKNKNQKMMLKKRSLFDEYVPKSEVSYTGMAFPNVDISRESYSKIFNEVMRINLVNAETIEAIQQNIIKTLDVGVSVHIEGCNDNRTKLDIAMHSLADPKTETNFWSCGSDVNIPVGEVYTAPQLKGTNGLLHVKEVLIGSTLYRDLEIKFVDGVSVSYTCQNGKNEEESKALLKNDLFNTSDNLPIGEFAIGTNTVGYVIAKKLGIINKLHTLIGEKMGPHIAIGDTCNARSEDTPMVDSVSGKIFTAVENEISCKRNSEPEHAYFNTHTDITIPYDDLKCLIVRCLDDHEISIIENGRFVLEGCEILNEPFN